MCEEEKFWKNVYLSKISQIKEMGKGCQQQAQRHDILSHWDAYYIL